MNLIVSIIVPVYKVPEQYLNKCVESIINQTYKELEIVLVDDGSPEQCGKICDDYAAKDSRIKVVHKKNGGVSAARNTGLEAISGKYVTFVDADDWIEQQTIEKAVEVINYYNADLVGWNHFYNYEDKIEKDVPRCDFGAKYLIYEKDDIQKYLKYDMITPEYDLRKRGIDLGAIRGVWGKLFSTELVKKFNIRFADNLKIGEDACFNLEFLQYATRAVFFDEHLSHYRITKYSANHQTRVDIVTLRLALLRKYAEHFDENDLAYQVCYCREVISCVVNCINKYFIASKNIREIRKRMNTFCDFIDDEQITIINKMNLRSNFFTELEKNILQLIAGKRKIPLLCVAKAVDLIKRFK